jgi:hypothetical protein
MHVLYIELSMRLLFRIVAHAHPLGWMTAGRELQFGIRALQHERVLQFGIKAKVSTPSLDGSDKWSSDKIF